MTHQNFATDGLASTPIQEFLCDVVEGGQLEQAGRLIDAIYLSRIRLETPSERRPSSRDERVLLVRTSAGEPVATLTLQSAAFDPCGPPLELEACFLLDFLGVPRRRIAEVRRVGAQEGAVGAARVLYTAALALSRTFGITHWIGLVDAGPDLSIGECVYAAAAAQGLCIEPPPLQPRMPSMHHRQTGGPKAATAIPTRVEGFARSIRARVCGVPCVHPHYSRLVIPMLSDLPSEPTSPEESKP